MKYFLSSKVLKLYCILYTLISIAVNIYCLIIGHDYTGLWHNIDRAIVLYLVMLLIVLLAHIKFNKKLINLLLYFLPLLLSLLAYSYLLYLRGIISEDLLIKLLLGTLILYAGLALISSIWKGIKNTSKSLVNGRSALKFSPQGLLIVVLIVLPILLWYLINGKDNILFNLVNSYLYIVGAILFVIICIALLLSNNSKDKISIPVYVMLIVYYICFILCFFDVVNVFTVEILQICAGIALIIYELQNRSYVALILTIITLILIIYACLSFFGF